MSESPRSRPVESAQLLVDLVNNHLDPGYAAAAHRRGGQPASRWYDRPAVIIGCVLAGFVIVVGYVNTHRSAPASAKVHDALVSRVRASQQQGDGLEERVSGLERQLSDAQNRVLPQSGQVAQQLDTAKLAAGLTAVAGPGFTVTLREPPTPTTSPTPGRNGSTPITRTNILTDRDVRSVVNELWHDGAEAISVNDVRLTPTSAIRFAGEAVLVDFQAIMSPYRIQAIGNPDELATNFAQSTVASRYQTLAGLEHIGFSFADSDRLTLRAGAPPRLRYAQLPPTGKAGHR